MKNGGAGYDTDRVLGLHEKAVGLDRIAFAEGGRAVDVYQTGSPSWTGQAQPDPEELAGMKEELGITSEMLVPHGGR